jgi:DNA-binding SARP family transcriptional activator
MSSTGVSICVLGPFQIFKRGRRVALRPGGKAEQLFSCLALQPKIGIHRETIVEAIWPDTSATLANQCLNTLAHSIKAQFADALEGQSPILSVQSHYALNLASDLTVDVLEFESAIDLGHRLLSVGSIEEAVQSYERAIVLYRGDLASGTNISALLERERLRAACLTALARLADAHFELGNFEQALSHALRLLGIDACREDAHRMAMRVYLQLGARAQALRQYGLCRTILAEEYDAVPEPATQQLFDLIRTDPGRV